MCPQGLAVVITLLLAYLQAGWLETGVPVAGIEDEVGENGLDTNKKLVQVGGSWNSVSKHFPFLGRNR